MKSSVDRKFEEFIQESERKLRSAQAAEVRGELSNMALAKIPRHWARAVANLARRAGMIELGLKIMTPFVRESFDGAKSKTPASPEELAEYAILLQRFGAVREALSILDGLDASHLPEVHLYRAYCHFNRWEYAEAVPSLEAYVASPIAPYQHLLGSINLASALVTTGQLDEAAPLLRASGEIARANSYTRLYGNCLEMQGQVEFFKRDYLEAGKRFAEAQAIFGAEQIQDQLFVNKWNAILTSFREGNVASLWKFRQDAVARGEAEVLREADFFCLQIEFHQRQFEHLYFGTPMPAYRQRISKAIAREPETDFYVYGNASAQILDVVSGVIDGQVRLPVGTKTHQLLSILLQDFYRPLTIGELFSELFPGEHFNIFSSTHRIQQVINRLRAWTAAEEIPVSIQNAGGRVRLKIDSPFAFRVQRVRPAVDTYHLRLARLKEAWEGRPFTAAEARESIGLTPSEFKRFAGAAVEKGDLERFGAARTTQYLLRAG